MWYCSFLRWHWRHLKNYNMLKWAQLGNKHAIKLELDSYAGSWYTEHNGTTLRGEFVVHPGKVWPTIITFANPRQIYCSDLWHLTLEDWPWTMTWIICASLPKTFCAWQTKKPESFRVVCSIVRREPRPRSELYMAIVNLESGEESEKPYQFKVQVWKVWYAQECHESERPAESHIYANQWANQTEWANIVLKDTYSLCHRCKFIVISFARNIRFHPTSHISPKAQYLSYITE